MANEARNAYLRVERANSPLGMEEHYTQHKGHGRGNKISPLCPLKDPCGEKFSINLSKKGMNVLD
jgi:hypothetical protein